MEIVRQKQPATRQIRWNIQSVIYFTRRVSTAEDRICNSFHILYFPDRLLQKWKKQKTDLFIFMKRCDRENITIHTHLHGWLITSSCYVCPYRVFKMQTFALKWKLENEYLSVAFDFAAKSSPYKQSHPN